MKHLLLSVVPGEALVLQLARGLTPVVGRPVESEEAERLVAQGSVFLNKVRWKEPGPPRACAVFEVFWPDLPVVEFTLDPARVVFQDEHLLVVDKPGGVNTAPSPFSDIDCLTWGVQKYLGPAFAIHAVHRLDRDTQGLVFFAKHKQAERALHLMFRERALRKLYRALTPPGGLSGALVHRWRDTLDWRGRIQTAATTAFARGTDEEGRGVWMVLPHTGRPHQIRRHFARYLTPLWGDRVYAPGVYSDGEVLGLACVAYRCRHPVTGERLEVFTPPVRGLCQRRFETEESAGGLGTDFPVNRLGTSTSPWRAGALDAERPKRT
jgi:23S rRNA-/tRNA-specific pseudouridylate synthase